MKALTLNPMVLTSERFVRLKQDFCSGKLGPRLEQGHRGSDMYSGPTHSLLRWASVLISF